MHKDVGKRVMALLLSLCMIAGMVDWSGFTAHATAIINYFNRVEIVNYSATYTGSAWRPEKANVKVYDMNDNPVDESDFQISGYGDNIDAKTDGTVTVVPTEAGLTKYQNISCQGTFPISPVDISGANVVVNNGQKLIVQRAENNIPNRVEVKVTLNGITLNGAREPVPSTSEADYGYSFSESSITTPGDKAITVTVNGRGNYSGQVTGMLNVTMLDESKFTLKYNGQSIETIPESDTAGNHILSGDYKETGMELYSALQDRLSVWYGDEQVTSGYELKFGNNKTASRESKAIVWAEATEGDYQGFKSNEIGYTVQKPFPTQIPLPDNLRVRGEVDPMSFLGSSVPVKPKAENIRLYDPDFPNKPLVYGTDYTINESTAYGPNNSIGPAAGSVTVTGMGAYFGNMTLEFEIKATILDTSMIQIDDSACIYDGTPQHDNLNVTVQAAEGGVVFEEGKDYDLSWGNTNDVNAGSYQVIVTPRAGSQLTGNPVSKTYNVSPCSMNRTTVNSFDSSAVVYDGTAHTKRFTMTGVNGRSMTEGTDYTVSYYRNTPGDNDNRNAGEIKVRITGKGNYDSTTYVERSFIIEPQTLDGTVTVEIGSIADQVYTGSEIRPEAFTVKVAGRTLTRNTDYTLSYVDNIDKGDATITITGQGNYKDFATTTFKILPKDIATVSRKIDSVEYTGDPVEAQITLTHNGRNLIEGTDFELSYNDEHTNVGSAGITITGLGNYEKSFTATFQITARNIGAEGCLTITADKGPNPDSSYVLSEPSGLDGYYYRYIKGDKVEPNVTVEYNDGKIQRTLTEGSDYTLSYASSDKIGTATITIRGRNNWGGTKTVQYKIKGCLEDYNIEEGLTSIQIPEQIYTGKGIEPEDAGVSFDGTPLIKGTDYDIENCLNNQEVTTVVGATKATADIRGKGDYYGFVQGVEFDIRPLDLGKDNLEENQYVISNIEPSYIYSGLPIEPMPTIKHYGEPLDEGQDYEVDYNPDGAENPNIAVKENWKLRIEGKPENYKGSKDIEFAIKPYDISESYAKIEIEGVDECVVLDWLTNAEKYTDVQTKAVLNGEKVEFPDLKIKYTPVDIEGNLIDDLNGTGQNWRYLDSDEYEVKYEENDTLGTATIRITGIGNFTGEITETFQIKGDLAGENTRLDVDGPWTYRPESDGGNTPEPTVTYTIHRASGDEVITLINGEDYEVGYADNEAATIGIGDMSALDGSEKATATFSEVKEEEKKTEARLVGSGDVKFDIYQKDISKAVGEGEEKDPDLEVKGVNENGYEYTGEEIVPEFELWHLQYQLSKGERGDAGCDYDVTPHNNTNVWDTATGEKSNTYATLAARVNADGKYDGNYYGYVDVKFTINPRKISDETIDTPEHRIENSRIAPAGTVLPENPEETDWIGTFNAEGEWECDYTRKPITFPKEGKELIAPENLSDGLTVIWYRDGVEPVTLEETKDYTIKYNNHIGIGDGEILIKAKEKSNYEGEFTKTFKIMASIAEVLNPAPRYMDLTYESDVPYGIVDVYPDLKFEDKTGYEAGERDDYKILEEGTDFVIVTQANHTELGIAEYSRNMQEIANENDDNPPTLVVAGTGHYKGNITIKYNIVPKDFSKDSGITVEFVGSLNDDQYTNAYVYDGQPKGMIRVYNNDPKKIGTDGYNIYDNNRILRAGIHYNEEWGDRINITTENSKTFVTIEAIGPYYTGKRTIEFSIVPQPIQDATVTVTPQTFDRRAKEPEITVSFNNRNLVEGTDYTILENEYRNNVNASVNAETDEERPTMVIQGIGGYGGTKTVYFDIAQEDINNQDDIETTGRAIYIEGNPIQPTIIVRAKDGTLLTEDVDYTVDEYTGEGAINTPGSVTIHGMGNYRGERVVSFMIYPPNGSFEIEPIEPQEFRNGPIKPEVKVSLRVNEEMSMELIEGQDYVLDWSNGNIQNAGTASVTAKGLGYFAEKGMQATQTFTITPKSIGEDGAIALGMSMADLGVCQYTGRGCTPKITLTFSPVMWEGEEGTNTPVELVQGQDYDVSYENNIMVGTAKAVISGRGNYTGTIEREFEIHANMNMVTVAPIPTQDYTGSAVTPLPVVSLGGQTLTLDKDYRVSYSNNVDRGTATITLTGIEPWYVGTRTVNFDIAKELSEATPIRGVAAAYTYTGEPLTPPVRVEDDDGNLLVMGVDYELSYSQNIDVGTANVLIKGIGKYTGSTSTTFRINPQQLGRAKISPVSDQVYNGQEQNPPITVTSGDKTLENGKDYTVVYVNSATPGMASVIVKGEGNYTGTQTLNYSITVPGLTGVKFSKYTDKSVTITWNKNNVVTGYEVYNAKNRREVRINKASTAKGTVTKLKAGTGATFRVRAYVNKDGQYYYGPFTSVKTATAPNSTTIKSVASKKAKQAVVKWKKVSGATQYEVYRGTSKKGKYKKIATTKKTSYTDKKATGGKKYYYKIRVCKKISNNNYYSSYSAAKSVKAKK